MCMAFRFSVSGVILESGKVVCDIYYYHYHRKKTHCMNKWEGVRTFGFFFYILYRAIRLNMDNIVVKPLSMELCLLSHRIATASFSFNFLLMVTMTLAFLPGDLFRACICVQMRNAWRLRVPHIL